MERRVLDVQFLGLFYFANVHVDEIPLVVHVKRSNMLVHQSLHEAIHNQIALSDSIIGRKVGEDVANPRNNAQQLAIVVAMLLENHSSRASSVEMETVR